MNYKFSVLISVYYKEVPEYLDLALKSITDDQILKPDEIVLVKDGPLTEELDFVIQSYIEKYSGLFKIISLNKNQGLGKALNIGLQNCSYELVARMDGDDISKPERFLKQVDIFKENIELDVVGSWIEEFYIEEGIRRKRGVRKVQEYDFEIKKEIKKRSPLNHATVMYKKSKIVEAGNYLTTYRLEDYYLWYRMYNKKMKFYNIQKSLLDVRFDYNTSKRRAGLNLLIDDINFFKMMKKDKVITEKEFLLNILKWGVYRLLSPKIREVIQRKFLRS